MFEKIKSLFSPRIKSDTPLPMYIVYNQAFEDIPLSFVPTRKEALQVANRYLYSTHYNHYRSWCTYRNYDRTSPNTWQEYLDSVISPSDSSIDHFEIVEVDYDLDYFASMLRKLAHCLPLGFDFEYPEEFLTFFNADIYHPLVSFEPTFNRTLQGFLESCIDNDFDISFFDDLDILTMTKKGRTSHVQILDDLPPTAKEDPFGTHDGITPTHADTDGDETILDKPAHTRFYDIKQNGETALSRESYFDIMAIILQNWNTSDDEPETKEEEKEVKEESKDPAPETVPAPKKKRQYKKRQPKQSIPESESTPVEKEEQVPVEDPKPIVPEKVEIPVSKKRGIARKAPHTEEAPAPIQEAAEEKEAKGSPEEGKETPQPKKRGRKPKNK